MTHTALTPVFVGLRTGLHGLVVALTALVIVRAVVTVAPGAHSGLVVALAGVFLVTYAFGAVAARPGHARGRRLALAGVFLVTYAFGAVAARPGHARGRRLALVWLGVLSVEWILLVWLTPEAAYLVFPLFFLFLHLLGRWWGSAAIVVSTAIAICALGVHGGFTVGGVVGPLVGAGVALLIGLGYQALAREAAQREALMQELLDTRDRLATTEREAGVLAERARLAREIHDTVAQGLSSIQMLLHAAERADPDRPGIEHIRLARETAATGLADTRRFIRELSPPQLDEEGLGGALRRLASSHWKAQGLDVTVRVPDTIALPMHLRTALLRIAQGAIANVIQHAHARSATITMTADHSELRFTVSDDGDGFDPVAAEASVGASDSFGLRATRERVEQLGGTVVVDTALGAGTTLAVILSLEAAA